MDSAQNVVGPLITGSSKGGEPNKALLAIARNTLIALGMWFQITSGRTVRPSFVTLIIGPAVALEFYIKGMAAKKSGIF